MITKRYNLINNIGGVFVFLVSLITYWLTLEPTASYWDCGEFIIQADKLEVGHPPGNPIFMLTARFFANFASDSSSVSLMVNAMSGLLSALTIMLLFWTISHLVRRLVVRDDRSEELSLTKYIVIMGSALCGSLAYAWSDTFWFSAVEGEVYAFSSFCTALVFWLILKWENRADDPHSDKYLILIGYIIGVSVAVHLLNLLCIPAIVLVFAYRKWKDMNLMRSLGALLISFAIIFFVLYGLVPGFIKVAQQFELFFVNEAGMSFNSGALIYAVVMTLSFIWTLSAINSGKSPMMIKISVLLTVTLSGMLFIGSGWWIGVLLTIILALWLYLPAFRKAVMRRKSGSAPALSLRVINIALWSMAMIFVGYSSYALILIRSTADTPMNQNSPDNVFDLASYLNREQYGENPLLYGETLNSAPMKEIEGFRTDTLGVTEDGVVATLTTPVYNPIIKGGKSQWVKGVKGVDPKSEYDLLSPDEINKNSRLAETRKDYYVKKDHKPEPRMNPELNMLFPRIYSKQHTSGYQGWVNLDTTLNSMVTVYAVDKETGAKEPELDTSAGPKYNEMTGTLYYPEKRVYKPSFFQNIAYFLNYQLNHMYTRYFLWNFAGRQNDILNQQGELDAGNWLSGIPFIDNYRLGDQSLLPDDLGKNNPGHNVYYMLPLILGLIGLVWQSFAGKRGIEQFWVVFFLFFMTGIAIVLYLNQTPGQPRERDYAFAGSFYAFAIWLGMGVAGIWRLLLLNKKMKRQTAAIIAAVIGVLVPVQMVSQTWDDHDRSGRTAARDFAINYLESLEPNAIVFCNGDNDTFPLWYAQEVEGVRPDVKIINLSYLNSDWYADQQRMPSYDAPAVKFTANPQDYAYGKADVTIVGHESAPIDLLHALKGIYGGQGRTDYGYPAFSSSIVRIPVDRKAVIKRGLVAPKDTADIVDYIEIDLGRTQTVRSKGYISLGELLMLDIIATNAANGWERPIYWANTVGDEYHVGLTPYLRSTGMTHQLVPTYQEGMPSRSDRAFKVITEKYKWGGADVTKGQKAPYYDETARRMLISTRSSVVDLASELLYEADRAKAEGNAAEARKKYLDAKKVANLLESKLPEATGRYSLSTLLSLAELYCRLGENGALGDKSLTAHGHKLLEQALEYYAPYVAYNRAITASRGNVALTYETRFIPYQYYRIVEIYNQYGGNKQNVDKVMKKYHLNLDELKNYYDQYMGVATAPSADESLTVEAFAEEIAKYCEIANEMASLSEEEYAQRSDDEKMIDTQLQGVIDYFLEAGGTEADLEKYESYRKLDKERTRRMAQ